MFCGPHDNQGRVSFRRIDTAIGLARRKTKTQLPLIICGDGNDGEDCMVFLGRAQSADLNHVIARHCALANTLSNAESLSLVLLNDRAFKRVEAIHLVTDLWHMRRASLFLRSVLHDILPRRVFLVRECHVGGEAPPPSVLDREEQGIQDFLAGHDGSNPPTEQTASLT